MAEKKYVVEFTLCTVYRKECTTEEEFEKLSNVAHCKGCDIDTSFFDEEEVYSKDVQAYQSELNQ